MATSGLQCIGSQLRRSAALSRASLRLRSARGKRITSISAGRLEGLSNRHLPDSAACDSAAKSVIKMDTHMEELIAQIHLSSTQMVIYATGGGFQALSWLLTMGVPSGTLLDARLPTTTASLTQLLGAQPSSDASPETTALALAEKAYQSASSLATPGAAFVGLSCSAALTSDNAQAGIHRMLVAAHSSARQTIYQIYFKKGARTRAEEDAVASRLLIRAFATAAGITSSITSGVDLGLTPLLAGLENRDAEHLEVKVTERGDPLEEMLAGRIRTVEYSGGQVVMDAPRAGRLYLPGSFNPLHEGHKQLLAAAVAARGGTVQPFFELSVGNPDKGILPLLEVQRRVAQFVGAGLAVVVTQAPLFTQKAELFPQSTFVVGYDTALRLLNAQYYGNDIGMLLQFGALRMRGCSFLVAGRREESGAFKTLHDITVPESLQGLFASIPEKRFRADISSTELRQRQAN